MRDFIDQNKKKDKIYLQMFCHSLFNPARYKKCSTTLTVWTGRKQTTQETNGRNNDLEIFGCTLRTRYNTLKKENTILGSSLYMRK